MFLQKIMEEINYRLQNQNVPIPTAVMAIKDPRNPSEINSWNQNVQILPQKVIINNSEPSGGVGSGTSNIRGAPGITKTIMEEINYRLQSAQSAPPPPIDLVRLQGAPQSAPPPPTIMTNRDNINSTPHSRDPRDMNSWNQNVQILPEKATISNSEPTEVGGVGIVGSSGVGNSNIRGAGKQKPYACSYCEKKFSHVHLMKQHVRIHTGEKPFACKYCEKRFTQSHSVKGGLISDSFIDFCHFLKTCA